MSGHERIVPNESQPGENRGELINYDLTPEQKATLSLEMKICLAFATNAQFQEEPHAATDINKFLAAEIGLKLDDSDEGKANKERLQKANREIKKDKLVDFQMVEGGIQPILMKEGYVSLASEIEKVKKGSTESNGDVDALD